MHRFVSNILIIIMFNMSIYACDIDCGTLVDDQIKTNIFLNYYEEFYNSQYHNLGTSEDIQKVFIMDFDNRIKVSDNIFINSVIRFVDWDANTNYRDLAYADHIANGGNPNIDQNTQLGKYFKNSDRTKEQEYNDIHFTTLYVSGILPEINGYKHLLAIGTMPFQGGSFEYYKHNGPSEGTGMSLLINMPLDAIMYVGDLSDLYDVDRLQIRIGYGEYLKFANTYQHNEMIGIKTKGTTSKFINFDLIDGHHNFKLEAYQSEWKYSSIPAGTLTNLGVGYAFDDIEHSGFVAYGSLGYSNVKGSYNAVIESEIKNKREDLINFAMNTYHIPYSYAAAAVDYQLSNINNSLVSQIFQVPASETGYMEDVDADGWAFQVGMKQEWWIEHFDVDLFLGAEYFQSSKNWATQTLRGLPRHGIDPLLKGKAYEIYTGIKNNDNFIFTVSYVQEIREWGSMYANDVIGVSVSESSRYLLEKRDMIKFDIKWMFFGL